MILQQDGRQFQNQTVRDAINVKAGDRFLVVSRSGTATLLLKPMSYSQAVMGLGRGVYPNGYLTEEREAWR